MGVGLAPGLGSAAAFVVVVIGAPAAGVALHVSANPQIIGVVWTFVLFSLHPVHIDKDYMKHME